MIGSVALHANIHRVFADSRQHDALFLGAAFIVLMPIGLKNLLVDGFGLTAVLAKHIEITTFGVLIIFFLIVEPHGLARLWQIIKEKLRLWPFPH